MPPDVEMLAFRERVDQADNDAARMKNMLEGLRLRDDPTSRGNANRYSMDLTVPEDYTAAQVIMLLALKEPGMHFEEPGWTEVAHLESRGIKWLVPTEWNNEVPKAGVFTVRYFTERESCKDENVRRKLGEKYCGW